MDPLTRLLIAARDGDHDSLERFIRATQADVWRVCHHLGDPDSADDLAQETFERAIASIHRFRADGPARSWILTIARRTCADGTRRRIRRRRLGVRLADQQTTHRSDPYRSDPYRSGHHRSNRRGVIQVDESTTTAGGLGRVELDDLLRRLGEDRREAFVLTQVLGLPYAEAAEVLGCPIGTVRSRVSRARSDLLDMLDLDGSGAHGAEEVADPGDPCDLDEPDDLDDTDTVRRWGG